MTGRRSGLTIAAAIIVAISVLVTAMLTVALITNYQHLGRLAKVVHLVNREYLEPVPFSTLVDGAMKGIVGSLNDPYSSYLDADQYKQLFEQIQGSFTGIGVYVSKRDVNKLVVVSPIKGGPAERAGLRAGDVIVKVDGVDVAELDVDVAVSKIKGPEGSEVQLTIFREGGQGFQEFTIVREEVHIPVVTAELAEQDKRIGIIQISQFNKIAASEVDRALTRFQQEGVKGIVLDLRDNPGGELESSVDIASHFIPTGPVVHIVDRSDGTETAYSTRDYIGLPLVILINGGSASASEIVAGAVKDNGTGTLVGTKTFGKGIVQMVMQLDGGAALKLTTAKYLTPHENDIHKLGIEPDVEVEIANRTDAHYLVEKQDENEDVQLIKALEIIQGKIQ
ncbi:S41 family peptidase [Heliorestis acidaminivorans]|uniref:S41 family peptidase n=1 Tax=Heliorestis acidaminivorans TaxID=553427 RepID=A0A6I0ER74_9FIRM|nr:S41 family peptidase [Heliorestis acidaminivorans]KAB2950991.1 S41 family peptidase [Heliorestis acidaminivorans]